jgi:hypothetical protein
MVKVVLFTSICFLFSGGGQFHAEKVWLFSKKQYGGNTPIHKPGGQPKGPLTILLCFLEVKKGESVPTWNTATLNGNKFNVTTDEVTGAMKQDSVVAGVLKDSQTPAVVRPHAGYWLISLSLMSEGADGKANDEPFILTGKIGKKEVILKSNEPVVELTPVMMP